MALNLHSRRHAHNLQARHGQIHETPRTMAASDPSDVQLVAPALLQLNRGDKNLPYEPCPSPACGAPITSFPDCLECRDSPGLSLQCDSCWTDCASPCDDDDCHIPQPCYDEHCAVESCVDSACAADSCTDVTCPETVHCNATCFDTNCMYNFGDDMASFDNQDCGQANCFGFLPPGPGMNAFESNNDLLYPCPQATTPHHMHQMHHMPPPDHFDHFRLTDLEHQHDHIDHNRHKRRRIQPNGIQTNGHLSFDQQSEPWSDDQLDAMFSPQSFNTPIDPSFPGAFDFNCDPDCHHQLKHTDPWASEIASSLVSYILSLWTTVANDFNSLASQQPMYPQTSLREDRASRRGYYQRPPANSNRQSSLHYILRRCLQQTATSNRSAFGH